MLCGYSQGALVVAKTWRDHILNGSLNHRLSDVSGVITFGDPMRCPGIANGNVFAGQALPKDLDGQTTGGIAGPDCLTPDETPHFYLSFANDGDLYASAPVGADPWHNEAPAGADETLIYNIVQNATVADVEAIAEEVLQVITKPLDPSRPTGRGHLQRRVVLLARRERSPLHLQHRPGGGVAEPTGQPTTDRLTTLPRATAGRDSGRTCYK